MAAIVNARDKLLQASGTRFTPTSTPTNGLNNATVFIFRRTVANSAPATPTVSSTYTFSPAGLTVLNNFWSFTMPATGGGFLWVSIAVASATTATDDIAATEWTPARLLVQDGAAGSAASLLSLSSTGQAVTYSGAGVATPPDQTLSFTANLQNLAGTATFVCTKYSAAGVSLGTVTLGGSGNTRTLTDTQFTTAAAYAVVTATLNSFSDTMTVVRLADGAGGVNGVSAMAGYLTNENVTIPSASDGSGAVLSGVTGNFKVFQGTTDVTAGCTFVVVGSPAVTTAAPAASTGAYSVTAAGSWGSASMTTSVTYRATHTASGAIIDRVLTITKAPSGASVTGARGAGAYYAISSPWSDAVANAAVPSPKVVGDQVTISNNNNYTLTKRWDGSAWNVPGTYLDGSLFVTGTIVSSAIDTRGLAIRDAAGNVILGLGNALAAGYEAPGTKNVELVPSINSAATTAQWSNIVGQTDAPANKATVGADASNLQVGIGGKNLITSNTLPTSAVGFGAYAGTLGAGTVQFAAGRETSAQYSPTGVGVVYIAVGGVKAPSVSSSLFPSSLGNVALMPTVQPGRRYEFSVAMSTHRSSGQLFLHWYDTTGTRMGGSAQGNVLTANSGNYVNGVATSGGFGVAPSGSKYAMVEAVMSGTNEDSPYMFCSQWYLGGALATQTVLSPYSASAAETLSALAAISSDNVLSKGEKSQVVADWNAIDGEKPGIVAQASALAVDSAAYVASWQALSDYLVSLSPGYGDTTQDTTIVGATFSAKFTAYYTAKTAIQNAMAAKAATRADWANVASRPGDDAILNNMIDLGWWKRDAAIPWTLNGEYNRLVMIGTDVSGGGPKGPNDVVWFCQETTGDSQNGGGWDNVLVTIDPTKTYRFVLPIKRIDGTGNSYWGTGGVCGINTTTNSGNPYFAAIGTLPAGEWFLFVGYIFPAGSTGNTHDGSGVYSCKTGALYQTGLNFNATPGVTIVSHRAYQFYASLNAKQMFGRPMINVVDGTEPSLREYFAATAVLNSQQQWADVGGLGKPANGATVGAPADTYVGSTLAQTVESNASTALANAAAANNAVGNALTKTGGGPLSGVITMSTNGAVQWGTAGWTGSAPSGTGMVASWKGLAGVNAGVATFYIDATTGRATFADTITSAATIAGVAAGTLTTQASAGSTAQTTLTTPITGNGSGSNLTALNTYNGGTSYTMGSRIAVGTGGTAGYKYDWSLDGDVATSSLSSGIRITSSTTSGTVTLASRGATGDAWSVTARCMITDLGSGRIGYAEFYASHTHT